MRTRVSDGSEAGIDGYYGVYRYELSEAYLNRIQCAFWLVIAS